MKTVRFSLSGHRIFGTEPVEVTLEDTGRCLEDYRSNEEELLDEEYLYSHPTTLRDISILLYQCCGAGVIRQLSIELAVRLSLDVEKVEKIVGEIIGEYANLIEEQANARWENLRMS